MTKRMIRLVLILEHLSKVQAARGISSSSSCAVVRRNANDCSIAAAARTRISSSPSISTQRQHHLQNTVQFIVTSSRGGQSSQVEQATARDVLEQYHLRLARLHRTIHPIMIKESTSSRQNHTTDFTVPSSDRATLRELAVQFVDLYPSLPPLRLGSPLSECSRKAVLEYLACMCTQPLSAVEAAIAHFQQIREHIPAVESSMSNSDKESQRQSHLDHRSRLSQATARLREACTPQYEAIVRSLLEQDTRRGMQCLLTLRADLRQWLTYLNHYHQHHKLSEDQQSPSASSSSVDDAELRLVHKLKQLDQYLLQTFTTWYAPGMLHIQRISYDATPASIIETIAKHEAVHPVQNLDDLRQRLGPNRRVFGLFHPLLPASSNPLVVLHVSLQQEIPSNMEQVHQLSCSTNQPRVATFYSISNLQSLALTGIGLGEYLIKEAVVQLQAELPSLNTFVTLSPIPGFRQWLEGVVHASGKFSQSPHELLSDRSMDDLTSSASSSPLLQTLAQHLQCPQSDALVTLVDLLISHGPECWNDQPQVARDVLLKLVARYLLHEKHRLKPLDPVTRFHVSNGAQVHDIHVGADITTKGWRTSLGCMVNYRYILDDLATNQARYEQDYTVPVSEQVQSLLSYQ